MLTHPGKFELKLGNFLRALLKITNIRLIKGECFAKEAM